MKLLERYVARRIVYAALLVMGVVAALAAVFNFLGELRDIGVGDYGLAQAAFHALLDLPFTLSQIFPMLVLLGGLMGLGQLASQHELLVMRASGFSFSGVMRASLLAVFVLAGIGMLIGEGIAPQLHHMADVHKTMAQSGGQAIITATGLWMHEQNDFIHIERVMPHQHLEGVTRYQFDSQHRLLLAAHAESLDYNHGHWQVHNLAATIFHLPAAGEKISAKPVTQSVIEKEAVWNLRLNPAILNAGLIEPEEMSLNKLRFYSRHLVNNGLQAVQFQFSFWKRVLQPLSILVMLFLAIPLVFAAPPRVPMGWRLAIGVMTGFGFYLLDALVGQLCVVFQLPSFVAAFTPLCLFALTGYFLWKQVDG